MAEPITIPKDKSSFPEYLDFFKLRELGLEHVQKLGSELWTDYNLHDPGVTILEVLCYAITDLGYRANFDIKDLLARSEQDKNTSIKTPFGQAHDNNFHTAANILGCNPLTVNDFRKLLIDIPGVRNAWLEKSAGQEIRIGVDKDKKELYYLDKNNTNQEDQKNNTEDTVELKINGLYDICVEIEPQLKVDACGRTVISQEDIIKKVYEVFHMHRNLCEDIRDVVIYGEEEIAICADIELTAEAEPEEVMLQIYLHIEEFLSPTLQFYTLQEMIEKGKGVEEIFEGRPMTVPDIQSEDESIKNSKDLNLIPGHGFIDTDELKKLEPQSRIHVSDIHEKIMDIEGVLAIHKLVLVNYINDLPLTKGEKWCLPLTRAYRPHIGINSSKVNFLKGPLYFSYDKEEIKQRFNQEKFAKTKASLEPYQLDLSIPGGTHRDLQDYTSIQHEFPLTYGIGSEGIADMPTPVRQAKARQLKAYLLFFDQILANYLSQLSHIRELFAMQSVPGKDQQNGCHTYFTQGLDDVPGVKDLIKNFNTCHTSCSNERFPEDYPSYLSCITENKKDYEKRRNRFLDHLLSRFSESFTDYAMLVYKLQKENRNEQDIINSKVSFLEKYPDISRNRGKAFDMLEKPVWNTENVAGLKKRISALLGIENARRETLSTGEIVEEAGGWFYVVKDKQGKDTLKSKKSYLDKPSAESTFEAIQARLKDQDQYHVLSYKIPELDGYSYRQGRKIKDVVQYGFVFVGGLEDRHRPEVIAQSVSRFDTKGACEEALYRFICQAKFNDIACKVEQEKECYEYLLFDTRYENIFFRSFKGYHTISICEKAYRLFIKSAVDENKYEDIEENGKYGFELFRTRAKKKTIVAIHPNWYETDQERQDRKWAIIYYLDETIPEPEFGGTPGHFELVVKDQQEQTLLISPAENSVTFYKTEAHARRAYQKIRRRASDVSKKYYVLLNGPEEDKPFGFLISDRDNTILAQHPVQYASEAERDLAINMLMFGIRNQAASYRHMQEEEGYRFELLDMDHVVIMRAAGLYSDAEASEAGWNELQDQACAYSNYRLINDEGAKYPFSFELLGKSKNILAIHTKSYATESTRDLMLQSVINYSCYTEYDVNITGTAGTYTYALKGKDGRILLESADRFADESTARSAYWEMVQLAKEHANYSTELPEFRFEIMNENHQAVARPPAGYTFVSANEREAAIAMIMAYLRDDKVNYEIENVGGSFYSKITDGNKNRLLKGCTLSPSHEKAEVELEALTGNKNDDASTGFVQDPKYYKISENLKNNCPYGFYIQNEDGNMLARHPLKYHTTDALYKAQLNVLSWVSDWKKLKHDIIRPHQWNELKDWDENVLLMVDSLYLNDEGIDSFRKLASKEKNYSIENKDNFSQIVVRDHNKRYLAYHPRYFQTKKDAEKYIATILLFIKLNGVSYTFFDTEKRYTIVNEKGGDLLVCVNEIRNYKAATEVLLKVCELGSSAGNYKLVPGHETPAKNEKAGPADDPETSDENLATENPKLTKTEVPTEIPHQEEPATYGFELLNNEVPIARNVNIFSSATERDDALKELIAILLSDHMPSRLTSRIEKFCYELTDFSGKVLLSSRNFKEFNSREEAAQANNYNKYLALAIEAKNYTSQLRYQKVPDENHEQCFHSFHIADPDAADESTLFGHPSEYTCQQGRDEMIATIIILLSSKQYNCSIEGIPCGFTFSMKFKMPFGSNEKATMDKNLVQKGKKIRKTNEQNNIQVKIVGAIHYPSKGEAWKVAGRAGDILKNKDNYLSPDVEEEAIWLVKNSAGETVARVFAEGGNEEEVRDFIIHTMTHSVAGIPYNVRYQERALYYQLEEGGSTLLKSTKGIDCPIFAHGNGSTNSEEKVVQEQDAHQKACGLSNEISEYAQHEKYYRFISNEEECLHGFEVVGGTGTSIATHDHLYLSKVESRNAINKIIQKLNNEGMHLLEHILLRPRNSGLSLNDQLNISGEEIMLQRSTTGITNISETRSSININEKPGRNPEADKFLPIPILCHTDDDNFCPELSDPYSFRVTIVLPYWPKRFNDPGFREFMETTLRRETPAHILPRICWLDTCQMKTFEKAYQRWLNTLDIQNKHCDATAARDELIEVLKQLRSIYPEAHLHDCEQRGLDNNKVILDHTRLG